MATGDITREQFSEEILQHVPENYRAGVGQVLPALMRSEGVSGKNAAVVFGAAGANRNIRGGVGPVQLLASTMFKAASELHNDPVVGPVFQRLRSTGELQYSTRVNRFYARPRPGEDQAHANRRLALELESNRDIYARLAARKLTYDWEQISRVLGRTPNATEAKAAWVLGPARLSAFLAAADSGDKRPVSEVFGAGSAHPMSRREVDANARLFGMTAAQLRDHFSSVMGVGDSKPATPTSGGSARPRTGGSERVGTDRNDIFGMMVTAARENTTNQVVNVFQSHATAQSPGAPQMSVPPAYPMSRPDPSGADSLRPPPAPPPSTGPNPQIPILADPARPANPNSILLQSVGDLPTADQLNRPALGAPLSATGFRSPLAQTPPPAKPLVPIQTMPPPPPRRQQ